MLNFCTVTVKCSRVSRPTFEECGLRDVIVRNNCHRNPQVIQFLKWFQTQELRLRYFAEIHRCLSALLWMRLTDLWSVCVKLDCFGGLLNYIYYYRRWRCFEEKIKIL